MRILNHTPNCFVEGFHGDESAIKQEMKFSEGDDEATCMSNKIGLHTTVFKYLGNGHVYIALNSQAFFEFVCSWLGSVHECYTIHSRLDNQSP